MYYNNLNHYVATIEISFFEFLEIMDLNPTLHEANIIKDIVKSHLKIHNGELFDFEYRQLLDVDSILIKVWATQKIGQHMYQIVRNCSIPKTKPSNLYDVLNKLNYNFDNSKNATPLLKKSDNFENFGFKTTIKKQTQTSKYNGTCSNCGSPAYVGLNSVECSKRCQ